MSGLLATSEYVPAWGQEITVSFILKLTEIHLHLIGA